MFTTSKIPPAFPTTRKPSTPTTTSLTPPKSSRSLASEFGFEHRWGFCARYLPGNPTAGLRLTKIRQLYREADAIFNVCGTQEFNDDLRKSDRILYVESDPGVEQIKVDQDESARPSIISGSIARSSPSAKTSGPNRFPVPLHKLKWLPTRQPVVTDLWKTSRAPAATAVFTSIANWSTSGLKDIDLARRKISLEQVARVPPLRRRAEKVRRSRSSSRPTSKTKKRARNSSQNGWRFRAPHEMSVDYWEYRDYIRRSKGEFTVAKDQYVRLHTGWFSDRSACYLAAGRPVITQETGFTDHYGRQRRPVCLSIR